MSHTSCISMTSNKIQNDVMGGVKISSHKYIKREWTKGKWVYTYPTILKKNTDGKTKTKTQDNSASDSKDKDPSKKFKYIKREWKNGKWYYTYPEDLKDKVNSLLDKAKDKLGFDEKERMEAAKKEADKTRARMNVNYARSLINATDYNRHVVKKEAASDLPRSIDKAREAGLKFLDAKKEFMNTPLGKLEHIKQNIEAGIRSAKHIFKVQDRVMPWEHSANVAIDEKARRDKAIREKEEARRKEELMNNFKKTVQYRGEQAKERLIRAEELKNIIRSFRNNPASNPLPSLPIKSKPMTHDEDEAVINPNYDRYNDNTSKNCAYCSIAYDLRSRGYDVKAIEQESQLSVSGIEKLYDGAKIFDIQDVYKNATGVDYDKASATKNELLSVFYDELRNQGEGARGNLCVYWEQGGGHSMVYEVENGAVVIRDCQLNAKWKLTEYPNWTYADRIFYIRTDDCTPKKDILKYIETVK